MGTCLTGPYIVLVFKCSFVWATVRFAYIQVPLQFLLLFCYSLLTLLLEFLFHLFVLSSATCETSRFVYTISLPTVLAVGLPLFLFSHAE